MNIMLITTILYVAGKSGGHIMPAITLARQQSSTVQAVIVTTQSKLDDAVVRPHASLFTRWERFAFGTRGVTSFRSVFQVCCDFISSCYAAYMLLREVCPTKVVSMGGAVSLPVCWMAKLLGIPYEIYELNVVPGTAIKMLQYGATQRYCTFVQVQKYLKKMFEVTTYPLRYTVGDLMDRTTACKRLACNPHKRIIFILGGSQGSQKLNRFIESWIREQSPEVLKRFFIIHQSGIRDEAALRALYIRYGIDAEVFSYRNDIATCYSAADLVVTRAGAGALNEIQFFTKDALIIPLESTANDHQVANAQVFHALYPRSTTLLRESMLRNRETMKQITTLLRGM